MTQSRRRAQPPAPSRRLTLFTLLVTNAIKLGGLALVLHEVFAVKQPRSLVFVLAAFMMTGAQISEETVVNLVSRMFGAPHEPGAKPPASPPAQHPGRKK